MWRTISMILISIFLGACVAFPQQEPEEFGHVDRSIKIGMSTKADVIELLGEPQWEDPRDGSLHYSGKVVGQTFCAVIPVPAMIMIAPVPYCESEPAEDWWIEFFVDEKNVITSVETKMEEAAEVAISKMQREKAKETRAAELRVLAEQGDTEAAKELVKLTGETTTALRELARSGDATAAILLARYANEREPLVSLAKKGNYIGAYWLYKESRADKEPAKFVTAWRWLCLAASTGYAKAQGDVGDWHRPSSWKLWEDWNKEELSLLRKVGVQPDNRIAYMWYTLAIESDDYYAADTRNYIMKSMTEEEIAQAERIVRDWKPGDCPSAEHRLGPPGET